MLSKPVFRVFGDYVLSVLIIKWFKATKTLCLKVKKDCVTVLEM